MTLKQHWSRVKNVHAHATSNTKKGKKLREELFKETGKVKFKEKNFQKMNNAGKTYKKTEIRTIVSKIEKKHTKKLDSQWRKARKAKKTKLTKREFRRVNRHAVDFDIEDIEVYYDS